ncbi:hypothetical protein AVEN_231292-1 [Araneus ventricosus]|uniref:Pre-C2HC domain-containing protein n=1 Tax=Araneus ventricosus TaxID=182803 RepID=A0A4Y2CIS5_ARAVE|nr:hypothetical protein AVEN_231292-1 [Araneus ventricosus]
MDPALQAYLNEWMEANEKEKEGRPPTPMARKLEVTKRLRNARKRLKKDVPNSEIAKKVLMEIDTLNEAMACVDISIANTGRCPVLNCSMHPTARNSDTRSEGEASICTDMDTSSLADEQDPKTPEEAHENDFQMVLPCKAAKITHQEEENTTIQTANKFSQLGVQDTPRNIPEINLKVTINSNLILKEICQQFPNTENRLRKEFIGIKTNTELNREKIIILLKEKKLEFMLTYETYESRPLKVVIRHLPREMDQQEITQSLEEKGFKIERITQMKNYREKTLLPLYLADIKKIGNFANIYNNKELCYFRVKIEPYRKRTKAIICFNCSGFYHSTRNCHMKPRCIKCNGEHTTRDCNIKEKIVEPTCINCGEKFGGLERL